jgi:3-hydroxyisobutyrate dehydrogenase
MDVAKLEKQTLGFIGTGTMGEPMAMNLLKAGTSLVVWNRSPEKTLRLRDAGAIVVGDCAEVFVRCEVIFLMMGTPAAIDSILERGSAGFTGRVAGHIIVVMGTPPPEYSKALEDDIRDAGGRYVEAPVSGSRAPAEAGRLLGMLAGESGAVTRVRPLLKPMCHMTFVCGSVPSALHMKLAINLYMVAMVVGLGEAIHFAGRHEVDLGQFMEILDAGPMASPLSRIKAPKLVQRDFSAQAAAVTVLENTEIISGAARKAGVTTPMLDVCQGLLQATCDMGFGAEDLVAIIQVLEDSGPPSLGGQRETTGYPPSSSA